MTDTRSLMDRISAFRERLDSLPRLSPASLPATVAVPDQVSRQPDDALTARIRAGSRTQAVLEQSVRTLSEEPPSETTSSTPLTARARRVLTEARELIDCMKRLADEPLLAGPPADQGSIDTDPLAIYYRETASMLVPAVRLAGTMPDMPSVQTRLAEGLEGILGTVRQRLAALGHALGQRRRDDDQVNRLSHLLVELDGTEVVDDTPLLELAAEVLADSPAMPLRFLYTPPTATQAFLGGPVFPAPARFIASHGLTCARVVARMLRHAPEWRDRPLDPILVALVHDVGMMRIPAVALSETGRLTEEHRRAIETHPRVGAEIISIRLPSLSHLTEAIAAHHERLDGTGYPSGLKGEQIQPLARLLAAADMYAAMCCPRPHRIAFDPRTALTDTLLHAEQNILDRFAAEKLLVMCFYPVGSVVEMSDGAIGIVAANRQGRGELHLASRPVLNLLIDPQGRLLPVPLPIDLAECEGGTVVRTLRLDERARRLGRHYPEWAI